MTPDMVADVGNSRVKWGRCTAAGVTETIALPHDDPRAWQQQMSRWHRVGSMTWALAGVHPAHRDRLRDWLTQQGHSVHLVEETAQLPLRVQVEHPDRVGIDRLLNAVAAHARRRPETSAIIVDAGSAVTVDFVDASGAFCGGAIFPGFRLMTRSLHDYTALLPEVAIACSSPALPAGSTVTAIQAGVYYAVVGGINHMIRQMERQTGGKEPRIFLTGGDARLLQPDVDSRAELWLEMTLEGLRVAAEALP